MKNMNYTHGIIMNYSKYLLHEHELSKIYCILCCNLELYNIPMVQDSIKRSLTNDRSVLLSHLKLRHLQNNSHQLFPWVGKGHIFVFPGSSTLLSYRYNPRQQNTHHTHVENLSSIVVVLFKNTRHR